MAVRAESVARRGAQRVGGEVISESMDVSCVLWYACVVPGARGDETSLAWALIHTIVHPDGLARRHQVGGCWVHCTRTGPHDARPSTHCTRPTLFARLGPRLCTQPSRYAWPSTFSSYHEPLSQLGLGSPSSA